MGDLSHFKDAYDDLTSIVIGANHNYLPGHLGKWFELLDTTPVVSAIMAHLGAKVDFWSWYREQLDNASKAGMGGGRLDFPNDPDKQLGIKVELFRQIAAGRLEAYQVGYTFIRSS